MARLSTEQLMKKESRMLVGGHVFYGNVMHFCHCSDRPHTQHDELFKLRQSSQSTITEHE